MAKIKILVEESDWEMLIADGEPPLDAVGVRMLVEEKDGKDYEVLNMYQKIEGGAMRTRIVAKFWIDQLGEYNPPS